MIISRTPLRVSFFGGGTDYPAWYREHGGAVLATAIDKYCYLSCRHLPPYFEHKSKIVYSKTELVNTVDEIRHPSVREALKLVNIRKGVEIHYSGDLPSRSGLGSSSTFTVGLLNALNALRGKHCSKKELAETAIHLEQNLIGENVGSQDQVTAAYGGFNRIDFYEQGFTVSPLGLDSNRIETLMRHMALFFTGVSRTASLIAGEQIRNTSSKKKELDRMYEMVKLAEDMLTSGAQTEDLGRLMHENWLLKRSLSDKISTAYIDYIYEKARKAGAWGGKILGAGGGGFILFIIKPELKEELEKCLKGLKPVPFGFDTSGSTIICDGRRLTR